MEEQNNTSTFGLQVRVWVVRTGFWGWLVGQSHLAERAGKSAFVSCCVQHDSASNRSAALLIFRPCFRIVCFLYIKVPVGGRRHKVRSFRSAAVAMLTD